MKRLTRAILRLYPSAWRTRYEAELETLIDDTGRRATFLPDLFMEALKMRLTTINWRYTGGFALAGLAIATVVAFRQPTHYLAEATLFTRSAPGSNTDAARVVVNGIIRNVLSRTSLSNLIQNSDLQLYREELQVKPRESIIEDMKANDLHIVTSGDGTIKISYRGLSRDQASQTVARVITRIIDEGFRSALELVPSSGKSAVPTIGILRSADPQTAPPIVLPPNRALFAFLGVLAGLVAAFVYAIVRRAPRTVFLLGLTGVLLTVIPQLVPLLLYESSAVLIFDSPATLRHLTADPNGLLNRVNDTARSLRSFRLDKHFDSRTIDLETDNLNPNHLTIRIRNRNRFDAQVAVQVLINALIDAARAGHLGVSDTVGHRTGPWVEVLDPPNLSVVRLGWISLARLFYASLILAITAALTLAFNRFRSRPQFTAHPA